MTLKTAINVSHLNYPKGAMSRYLLKKSWGVSSYRLYSKSNGPILLFKTTLWHCNCFCHLLIRIRPIPSSPGPLFQNEGRCSAFDMEIIFHSHANKTHFHKKGCAPNLISKVRVFGTRKWPITWTFKNWAPIPSLVTTSLCLLLRLPWHILKCPSHKFFYCFIWNYTLLK